VFVAQFISNKYILLKLQTMGHPKYGTEKSAREITEGSSASGDGNLLQSISVKLGRSASFTTVEKTPCSIVTL
jgi:hypothetical protein